MKYVCDRARHLVCIPFSIENLHAMAKDLGINRRWFHSGKHPHYDIPKHREAEILARCEIVTTKEIYKIIHQ